MGIIVTDESTENITFNIDDFNVGDIITVAASGSSKFFVGSQNLIEKTIINTTTQSGTGIPTFQTTFSNHTNSITSCSRISTGKYSFNFNENLKEGFTYVKQNKLFKFVSSGSLNSVGHVMCLPSSGNTKSIQFETRNLSDVLTDNLLEQAPIVIKIYENNSINNFTNYDYFYRNMNNIIFQHDDNINIINYFTSLDAQNVIDDYIYINYKEIVSIPYDNGVYYILRSKIQSTEINSSVVKINFISGRILTIDYLNTNIAIYNRNYIENSLQELNLPLDNVSNIFYVNPGDSLNNAFNNHYDKLIYIRAGSYSSTGITCNHDFTAYCEDNVSINCKFFTKINDSRTCKIFGYGTYSWSDPEPFIDGGKGIFHLACKDINISSTGQNNPVTFSSIDIGSDYYVSLKGRKVHFDNAQYTFMDFDGSGNFVSDNDFAKIDLIDANLEYGFFQEEAQNLIIWRNAIINNYSRHAVIEYGSSYFPSEHILVNTKINNQVVGGTIITYQDSDTNNNFNLYIHSCWFESSSDVFESGLSIPIENFIQFNGASYTKRNAQSSSYFTFTNPNNIIKDSLVSL